MTDDLEKLLTDIDGDTVEKGLREAAIRDSEKISRQGDSILEDNGDTVDPEKAFIEKIDEFEIDEEKPQTYCDSS